MSHITDDNFVVVTDPSMKAVIRAAATMTPNQRFILAEAIHDTSERRGFGTPAPPPPPRRGKPKLRLSK